jgi:hypothetical protein
MYLFNESGNPKALDSVTDPAGWSSLGFGDGAALLKTGV